MVIVDHVLIVKLEQPSFASVSQQEEAGKGFKEGQHLIEILGRIDDIKASQYQWKQPFDTGFYEDVLGLVLR